MLGIGRAVNPQARQAHTPQGPQQHYQLPANRYIMFVLIILHSNHFTTEKWTSFSGTVFTIDNKNEMTPEMFHKVGHH